MPSPPKEAVYYVLKELRRYLEDLRRQLQEREDEVLGAEVSKVEDVVSQLERAIQEESYSDFFKALLKLRTMDISIIADDSRVRDTELYRSWEQVVSEAKKGLLPNVDLREFLEMEWQRLFLGVGIIQELSQLEHDSVERELIVGTFRDAFRHYYFALDKLTQYLKEREDRLLDDALEDIYYATWFMLNLRELLPEEYEEELQEIVRSMEMREGAVKDEEDSAPEFGDS